MLGFHIGNHFLNMVLISLKIITQVGIKHREMFVAMTSCPGIGIGSPLNMEEIKETIQRGSNEIKKDVETYEKYIRERGINRIEGTKRKGKKPKGGDVNKVTMKFEEDWRAAYFLGEK